jgi:hypothetical protein
MGKYAVHQVATALELEQYLNSLGLGSGQRVIAITETTENFTVVIQQWLVQND